MKKRSKLRVTSPKRQHQHSMKSPQATPAKAPARYSKEYDYESSSALQTPSKQVVSTSAGYVASPAPASPIHSKMRSQNSWTQSHPKAIFSPTQWRAQKALEKHDKKKGSRRGREDSPSERGPQGDPLGVLFTLLQEDPDILLYMKTLPRRVPTRFLRRPPILGPKKHGLPRNTIVLDLDETLVHCTTDPIADYDQTFNVNFNGHKYCVYMRKRPFMRDFLERCAQWFEVVIFTASQSCYANTLLDVVDPERKLIHHRVFRESCAHYKENFLKPLDILNRPLSNAFIIDNSPQCFGFQVENGIPITSWFEDPKDDELMQLLPFLEEMKDMQDVRPYIKDTFRVSEFLTHLPQDCMSRYA